MSLAPGTRLPDVTFRTLTAEGVKELSTADVFGGKKVVLFGVPAAFSPTCHGQHLPGYVRDHDAIRAKGVDTIACVTPNDVWVLDAWSKASGADGKVLMLSDGNGEFAKAAGLQLDGTRFGEGMRIQRFSAVVDDGVVTEFHMEGNPGLVTVTGADKLL